MIRSTFVGVLLICAGLNEARALECRSRFDLRLQAMTIRTHLDRAETSWARERSNGSGATLARARKSLRDARVFLGRIEGEVTHYPQFVITLSGLMTALFFTATDDERYAGEKHVGAGLASTHLMEAFSATTDLLACLDRPLSGRAIPGP